MNLFFVPLFLPFMQLLWINAQYRSNFASKKAKGNKQRIQPSKPRQLIRILMDDRFTLQVHCANMKSSSGAYNREAVRIRNEAELPVSIPDAGLDESDDRDSSTSGSSGRGGTVRRGIAAGTSRATQVRGRGRNPSSSPSSASSEVARAAAAVAAAAAAAAAVAARHPPQDPRTDPEYRKANDLDPETTSSFDLKDWMPPAKVHKRIVSSSLNP